MGVVKVFQFDRKSEVKLYYVFVTESRQSSEEFPNDPSRENQTKQKVKYRHADAKDVKIRSCFLTHTTTAPLV